MTLDDYWNALRRSHGVAAARPDFAFDAEHYLSAYPDLAAADMPLEDHWTKFGQAEGRHPTTYRDFLRRYPDLDAVIDDLVREPDLLELMNEEGDRGYELAFEAMRLGGPIDRTISTFSDSHYRRLHPDLAGYVGPLLDHYICYGRFEGRKTAAELLSRLHHGQQPIDETKPTCLIVLHELSRTGAPVVGMDLIKSAADTHQVHVIAFRGGPLLDEALPFCRQLLITRDPAFEARLLLSDVLSEARFALLNSAETAKMIPTLVAADCDIISYIHEFPEYVLPRSKAVRLVSFSALLVFSSEQSRMRWSGLCRDCGVDMDDDTVVVSQRPLVIGAPPARERNHARVEVERELRETLGDRKLVVGAGRIGPRKGVADFVLAAQLHAHSDPETLFVWIGSGWDTSDIHFGVWFEARLRAMRIGQAKSGAEVGPDTAQRVRPNLRFLDPGPIYKNLIKAADLFFLTSLLDPLPNVVFDAVEAGTPVLLFQGATGFDDPIYQASSMFERVPAGDLLAASQAITRTPPKSARRPHSASKPNPAPPMLSCILAAYEKRSGGKARSAAACPKGTFSVSLLSDWGATNLPEERHLLRRLGRTPFWRSPCHIAEALERAGAGWKERIDLLDYGSTEVETVGSGSASPDFALHCHIDDTEVFRTMLRDTPLLRAARHLHLTTDHAHMQRQILEICHSASLPIEACPVTREPMEYFVRTAARSAFTGAWGLVRTRAAEGATNRQLHGLSILTDDPVGVAGWIDLSTTGWGAARIVLETQVAELARSAPAPFPVPEMEGLWVTQGAAVNMHNQLTKMDALFQGQSSDVSEAVLRRLWLPIIRDLQGRATLLYSTR